jgi:hypothetical protein
MAGFPLQLLTAGPLRIERLGNGLRCVFNRSTWLWGGVAAMVPAAENIGQIRELERKMLRMVAGGPAASLAGGLLVWPALLLLDTNPQIAAGFLTFGMTSFVLGLCTLLPVSNFGFASDGQRIIQLWRGTPSGRRWAANTALSALFFAVRARDWPSELVALDGDGNTIDGVFALALRHMWHLDRREFDQAKSIWIEYWSCCRHFPRRFGQEFG